MTYVARKLSLDRRTFLRGVGAALALPWLDAMTPAFAMGRGPEGPPARAAFVFLPNGMHLPDWTPTAEGADFALPKTLEPLANQRRYVRVLSGLALDSAKAHGDGPGDHARACSTFLTCTHPVKTGGSGVRVGVSVDQVLAAKLGVGVKFASLELGCEDGRAGGDCDSGYACAYTSYVSWRTPTTPSGKETRPRAVFARLFGDETADDPAVKADRRAVLDLVLEDAKRLHGALGGADRAKLDEYLTAVRDLEKRLKSVEADAGVPRSVGAPPPEPKDFREHLRLMYDLMALAFRTDSTRIATFMPANAGSNRSYAFVGAPEGHHDLSHHGRDPEKQRKVALINRFHIEEFARFLDSLAAVKEGDRTLLDRSAVVLGSGISDGDRHNHDDLPILLCGGGDGKIGPARHVRFAPETPLANLHLTLLDRFNVRTPSFGDSTGRLAL